MLPPWTIRAIRRKNYANTPCTIWSLISRLFTWPERWETLQREHSVSLEVLQRLKQGGSLPVELTMTYHQVAAKEITMVFMHDLTARLQAEEKRRQYEMEMQHLQRLESLGLLAGGIAHDFNNLLTAILANISLVKMDLPVTGDHFEQLSEAEKASVQARDLTTQLLTFAKGGKPIKTAVHLERVIRDSSSLALRGQSVKCDLQIASDLLAVEADAGQLTQVFNNLFINACQAMPQGGVLTVSARNQAVIQPDKAYLPAGDYVQATLQDQGRGISPENLPKYSTRISPPKKPARGWGWRWFIRSSKIMVAQSRLPPRRALAPCSACSCRCSANRTTKPRLSPNPSAWAAVVFW